MSNSPSNFIDMTGKRFGFLKVIGRAPNKPNLQAKWHCQCVCGKETIVAGQKLRSGTTKSCGCSKPGHVTHGKSRTKTHNSWLAMKQRCYYEKSEQFHLYGGRGIKVCERWLNSFENFLADMGERPHGTTLDRIDSDADYMPENCRWATSQEQAGNRRVTKHLTKDGATMTVREWAEKLGVKPDVIYGRLRWGKSVEEALR